MFFDNYKLDYYLSVESINFRLKDKKIVNKFDNLEEILNEYKTLLQYYEISPVFATHGQIYTGEIVFQKNEYYKIAWDINFAMSIINEYKLKPYKLSIDYLKDAIDPKTLDTKYFKSAKKNIAPIIVASYPLLEGKVKHYILDGNHRVYSKYLSGENEIIGYILKPEHHFYAMVSDISRVLYLIHQSVESIVDYMVGTINKKELKIYLDNLNGYFDGTSEMATNYFNTNKEKTND